MRSHRLAAAFFLIIAGFLAAASLSGCVVRSRSGFELVPPRRPSPAAVVGDGGVIAVEPEGAGPVAGSDEQKQP